MRHGARVTTSADHRHARTALLLRSLLVLTFTAAAPPLARADDAPRAIARARFDPPGPVDAGQSARLVVDVLVTTWLTRQPALPPLELPGAVVAPSSEQPGHLTEQIDGTTWFGVSMAYLVTPMQGGDVTVPALSLDVSPGQAAAPVTVTTPPLTLAVRTVPRPPGAEHALGTTRFALTQRLDRSLDDLRVGDAVTRTIESSADGARAMLIPPVTFAPVPGLKAYPAAPQVEDVTKDRVGFVGGRRVDATTYVVQHAGRYELPAIDVEWWDTAAGRLRTASAPAVTFTTKAGPGTPPPIESAEVAAARRARTVRRIAAIALAVLAGATLLWLLAPWARRLQRTVARRRTERRRRWEASEAWAFERLRDAGQRGDAADTYRALLRWLERARPDGALTLDDLAATDADLAPRLAALAGELYGDEPTHASTRELVASVAAARVKLHADGHVTGPDGLPPLNPA